MVWVVEDPARGGCWLLVCCGMRNEEETPGGWDGDEMGWGWGWNWVWVGRGVGGGKEIYAPWAKLQTAGSEDTSGSEETLGKFLNFF